MRIRTTVLGQQMGLFLVMISLQEIYNAYFQCRKNKRKTINQIEFERNYEHNCIQLWKDINNRSYKIGQSICFIVTRPKLREIFAANFRDRVVHHVIMNKLEKFFEKEFIYDAYNCRKNKGTLFGVKRLYEAIKKCSDNYSSDCYIAKFDFKGFFMSIYKPLLWKKLHRFIRKVYKKDDRSLLLYLVKIVVNNCPQYNCIKKGPRILWSLLEKDKSLFTVGDRYGLPIGNLTSQVFANFYLNNFDHLLKSKFQYYGRYVDDFYVIDKSKNKILTNIQFIKNVAYMCRVKLHPKKIYLQHYTKGCGFTGSYVKLNRLYIGNRLVSNCTKCILRNNFYISCENVERFVSSINSYFGYLSHYNAYAIRWKLMKSISWKWLNFINISNRLDKAICKNKRINIIKNNIEVL